MKYLNTPVPVMALYVPKDADDFAVKRSAVFALAIDEQGAVTLMHDLPPGEHLVTYYAGASMNNFSLAGHEVHPGPGTGERALRDMWRESRHALLRTDN